MAHRLDGRDNIDGTIQLGSWHEGLVNNVPAKSQANSGLVDAVNVDIDDKGKLSRRKGYSLAVSAPNKFDKMVQFHDGFVVLNDAGSGYNLLYVRPDGYTELIPNTDSKVKPGPDTCFLNLNGEVYFSSKSTSSAGIISVNGDPSIASVARVRDLGVPNCSAPAISITAGNLRAGRYLLSCTLTNNFMEEGGAFPAIPVDVPENGGIAISFAVNPRLYCLEMDNGKINFYLSEPNGEVMFKKGVYNLVDSNPVSFTLSSDSASGTQLKSSLLNPMPYVTELAYCNGRVYGVDGNIVWYSEPFRYGQCKFQSNYMIFQSDVKLLASVQDGLYVADKMTYFVDCSNPDQVSMKRTIFPYSAVKGTHCQLDNEFGVSWMSDKGIVVGYNGGEVKNLQDPKFIPNSFAGGAMLHRYQNGISQLIASMFDEEISSAAVSDFADAEIRRAGTF